MYVFPTLLASVAIEISLFVFFLLACFVWEWGKIPTLGIHSIEAAWKFLCARKRLAAAVMGLMGFFCAVSVGLIFHVPKPSIHDEFCYLLAADTFSSGRLANPPHPMGRHFETFHVLQSPTYSVKYFPGQGLMLALGQKLTGHPIIGVWLNMGLLGAALCWMLQGWAPPGWAIIGSLIGLARVEFSPDWFSHVGFGYWAQSYWGGGVPALGGALVYGALPRLVGKSPKLSHAVLMGIGFSIMAISRPYEGVCASLPALAYLLYYLWRQKSAWKTWLCRIAMPIMVPLGLCLAWLGYYNFRVTGGPLLLPYWLYSLAYCGVPELSFLPVRSTPLSPHWNIWWLNSVWASDVYKAVEFPQIWQLLLYFLDKVLKSWSMLSGALWTVPLCLLPWMMRSGQMRFLAGAFLFATSGIMLTVWFFPHYTGPVLGLFLILLVQAIRHCHCGRLGKWRVGRIFTRALLLAFLVATACTLYVTHRWYHPNLWADDRAQIISKLSQISGKHLVVVHYEETHPVHEEWVYNAASIDSSRIVWARDMGAENGELYRYYPDRMIWRLDVDQRKMPLSLIRNAAP